MRTKVVGTTALIMTLAAAALSGCGGGSAGGGSSPFAGPSAEGVYGGTLTGSSSRAFQALVLENDEIWALYGTETSSVFAVAGFIQGSGTSNNGTFTSSTTKDFGFTPAVSGTMNATYDASAKTIAGSVSGSGGSVSFSGGPISGSLYNYNTAASPATIAGNWTATSLHGEGLNITVASGGSFTARSSLGCNFSGTILPRPSGKNVFNLALTFGPAPCSLANQAASGIALAYPLGNGRTQFTVAVTNSARTAGTAAFGSR